MLESLARCVDNAAMLAQQWSLRNEKEGRNLQGQRGSQQAELNFRGIWFADKGLRQFALCQHE